MTIPWPAAFYRPRAGTCHCPPPPRPPFLFNCEPPCGMWPFWPQGKENACWFESGSLGALGASIVYCWKLYWGLRIRLWSILWQSATVILIIIICLTLVLLNCFYCIFCHLKLELLTQFPATNDKKYLYFLKFLDLIIWLTDLLPLTTYYPFQWDIIWLNILKPYIYSLYIRAGRGLV